MDLNGRVVAITGASSGIGEATARACAEAGAQVALAARRADRIEALASELGGAAFATDIADEAQARAFVDGAVERFGRLDAIVNNAGVMLLGPVDGADTDEWRRMVDVNLLGLLYCTHAAIPHLREGGGGFVVNVSSVSGRSANAGSAVYNLTKFGVGAFSEALRQELIGDRIRVVIVEPGYVETELQAHNERIPAVAERIAGMKEQIGDVLQAEDIADTILWAITRPPRMAVNEVLVRPAGQLR